MKETLDECIRSHGFNGSVLVAKGDSVLIDQGYGFSDFENSIPNTPETKYCIGSITKAFTSFAIMKLHDKGLVDINDSIDKYIPEIAYGDKIKIAHLLSHSSGLDRNVFHDGMDIKKFFTSIGDMPKALSVFSLLFNLKFRKNSFKVSKPIRNMLKGQKNELLFEPGCGFSYSNFGYQLLGFIIEKVTNKRYAQFVEEEIFAPLGMKDSGSGYNRKRFHEFALGYLSDDRLFTRRMENDIFWLTYSAGGLYSTTGDLYKFDRMLYKDSLLRKDYLEQMFTVHAGNYGYGWFVNEFGERINKQKLSQDDVQNIIDYTLFYNKKEAHNDDFYKTHRKECMHSGMISGFTSYISRWVEDDVCIIALSNVLDTNKVFSVIHELIGLMIDNGFISCKTY